MTQLRIISEEHSGKKIYKVQRKKWYGWNTQHIYKSFGTCIELIFTSIEEAEWYILKQFTKPKVKVVKVVKNINVE